MTAKFKITIMELAPCIDVIYHMKCDPDEGYTPAGAQDHLAIRSGAKLRPTPITTYAGGKATNVASIMGALLRPEDAVAVELVVFRADSAEGRYIHNLQTSRISQVEIRPIIVDAGSRFCIDLSDPDASPRAEFNISPRVFWEPSAVEVVLEFASEMKADLVVLAGNPPAVKPARELASDLYSRIIECSRESIGAVSLDLEGPSLRHCISATSPVAVIKINQDEYRSISERDWAGFNGTLIVTDSRGCRLRSRTSAAETRIRRPPLAGVCKTIGAGDAFHAGFSVARWVWSYDEYEAACYGLAAASTWVTSPPEAVVVERQTVDRIFEGMICQRN